MNEDTDDDDGQFNRDLLTAIEASKLGISGSTSSTHLSNTSVPTTQTQGTPPQPPNLLPKNDDSNSFISERVQLERARLERQKRVRAEAGLVELDDTNDGDDAPPEKRQRGPSNSYRSNGRSNHASSSSHSGSGPGVTNALGAGETEEKMFWQGELRQTANKHVDPRKDGKSTFRLSELIGSVRSFLLMFAVRK